MTDVESFLLNVTGSEPLVKKAIKKIAEIVEKYETSGEIDLIDVATIAAYLLPNKEYVEGEFIVQSVIGCNKHESASGNPDNTKDPMYTKTGSWVTDSSRSAVWINDKLKVDDDGAKPYKIRGKVIPWSPSCRGGSVPAILVDSKEELDEKAVDGVDFAKQFSNDPYSPTYTTNDPSGTEEEVCKIQKDQLLATSSGNIDDDRRGSIKYHRNIE